MEAQMQQQPGAASGGMIIPPYNTRVIKEPRGMIRIIQLVFAILAFSITTSFDTETSFTISCYQSKDASNQVRYQKKSTYQVEYPFDMSSTKLTYLESCNENGDEMKDKVFDIDFSSSAQFFVATGVLSFAYTLCCLYGYIKLWHLYETNPFFPIVDLVITAIFTVFWLAGASAWAANVSDLKHYTGPRYLIEQLSHCNQTIQDIEYDCFSESPGKWSSLYISLIFGFANLFIWGASIWFVFKETHFHQRTLQPVMMGGATVPGMPPMMNTATGGGGGGMMGQPIGTNQQQAYPNLGDQTQTIGQIPTGNQFGPGGY